MSLSELRRQRFLSELQARLVSKIPVVLPKEIPLTAQALSPIEPKPKENLKARTYKPRIQPPEPEQIRPPESKPQMEASKQTPVVEPAAKTPVTPSVFAAKTPKKLTTVAAVYKPSKFIPDRLAIPLLKQNPPLVYPKSARRRAYQGSVVLKVLVAANGSVEAVELDQSCGYKILDRTALSAVREWQFKPGIKDGKKAKMWVKVPVRFELK